MKLSKETISYGAFVIAPQKRKNSEIYKDYQKLQ